MARTKRLPESTGQVLGGYVIYVPLPALALLYIHNLKLSKELIAPAIMPWIIFGVGSILFYSLYRFKKIDRLTTGCLILTACLGNTSFVGLPMIEAFYGKEALGIGILIDLAGTFLMLSTFGLVFATVLSDSNSKTKSQSFDFKTISYRILSFPPFIALVAALLLRPIEFSDWFTL
ncbi:MAG: AEC family transporter, partial [Leptonema sp. (in: Bacteria)]|nr:AEC family transporter [Leptonema sp. (in: bacteria)]